MSSPKNDWYSLFHKHWQQLFGIRLHHQSTTHWFPNQNTQYCLPDAGALCYLDSTEETWGPDPNPENQGCRACPDWESHQLLSCKQVCQLQIPVPSFLTKGRPSHFLSRTFLPALDRESFIVLKTPTENVDIALEELGEEFKKLNMELPNYSAILLLYLYPKELRTATQINTFIHMFIAGLLTVAKTWKQPKCPLRDK